MLNTKYNHLQEILTDLNSVVIAFSGGVDSSLLLYVASRTLGEKAVGVTVVSPSQPNYEREEAVRIAQFIGVTHEFVQSHELEDPDYRSNPPERCYFCKKEICHQLFDYAERNGFAHVVDGTNVDDAGDFRPGQKAAQEYGMRSPLKQAGFTKEEIKQLSRQLGLPNWDRPSNACLASRIPYGTPITEAVLRQIGEAEEILRKIGCAQMRVRHHNETARIEVPEELFDVLIKKKKNIIEEFKKLGYVYITLDLEGFRSGSMNEVI